MNIVTKTALANFRRNKSRNVLVGIAVLLTTILLTAVPMVLFGGFVIENEAIKEIYPTYHAMYRNVDGETAEKMAKDDRIKEIGFREDPAYMIAENEDVIISMVYADEMVCRENRLNLTEGRLPKKEDEIVVTRGLLEEMGLTGEIGDRITVSYQVSEDGGLSLAHEQEFTITGFQPDSKESEEKGIYSAMVSKAFADSVISKGQHAYRLYVKLAGVDRKVTDEIEAMIQELGEDYGIQERDIVTNSDMLIATYKDPAIYMGLAGFLLVTVFAGVITIYSIYYVSMLGKVQEYGKLRAIGATRKQIRKLVFREGLAVAGITVPIGLILGSVCGVQIMKAVVRHGVSTENILSEPMKQLIEDGKVSIIQPWILVLAAVVAFVTVYLALLRPMKIASRITAIEAIRYQGEKPKKRRAGKKEKQKKERKGYEELSIGKLTLSNLGRNKKRTAVTIAALGMTGIFFITVATLLSCVNPKTMTEEEIRSDVCVSINSWIGDKMHPEREIQNIQKNNPLTDELKEQILSIEGVEKVEESFFAGALITNIEELKEDDGAPLDSGISGVSDELIEAAEKYVTKGSLEDPKLRDGTGVILGEGYITHYTDLTVGDIVEVKLKDGDKLVPKRFEIVAVVDAPNSMLGNSLTVPEKVLQGMCEQDTTDQFDIFIASSHYEEAEKTIEELIANQEFLETSDYKSIYKEMEKSIGMLSYMGYGMLGVFGLIGILNLVNTMINSVHVRKKELGMLQAIGMSDRQTVRMLQLEGLVYTVGTLILSLGVGSLTGYALFLKARQEGMFGVRYYEYPVVPAVILIVVVLLLQILITYLVNSNFKKQSLIDRVRFAE